MKEHTYPLKMDHIAAGVCYYPEHWGETYWKKDLQLMKELGLETARVGEFAWNFFEPREGVYDFALFDRFLDEAKEAGVKIIFCTPTCTPPAWLSRRYPETLNTTIEGNPYRHGMRQHHNMTSPVYLEKCDRLIKAMASHFGSHPAIIGWQLDNEINCEISTYYSPADHAAFREYLQQKYRSIEEYNQVIGGDFWNQSCLSFDDAALPGLTICNSSNPHVVLESKDFVSHIAIQYMKRQADIIRKYIDDKIFITTNGIFPHLDYQKLIETGILDFITYDSYPNFGFAIGTDPRKEGAFNDRNTSFNLARVRSISPCFGIMEQQSGGGGWNTRLLQPAPKPGQLRLWSFQSIAHGADFVHYFRFRTSDVGTEIYWTGLFDQDSRENRRVKEARETIQDFAKIHDVAGKPCLSRVAILQDYRNNWDAENDIFLKPLNDLSLDAWFKTLQRNHIPFDFVDFRPESTMENLASYDLLIAPHDAVLTEKQAALLEQTVSVGKTLILGARTGCKDEHGHILRQTAPGLLRKLAGCYVEEYTVLGPDDVHAGSMEWKEDHSITAVHSLHEILIPEEAETLASYTGTWYKKTAALVSHSYGKGTVYYLGSAFSGDTAEKLLLKMPAVFEDAWWLNLPPEVELTIRGAGEEKFYFLLNYKPVPMPASLTESAVDLLTGKELSGEITIPPYGVLVLKKI